ncbi:MAG: metallophosphoesterase [Lachnospiraceae bacterium]|nr:metallophosphoesterase [Lachnospiraceae bacterium]
MIILDTHRFVVARDFINTSKVKGSIKIAFLSDLHDKHFGENNEKLLAAVRKEKPDLVLIGGDMITAKLGEDITETMAFLKELAKDNTVYYGIGNHEYRVSLYPENYGSLYDDFLAGIQEAGIRILRNEVIEDKDKNIRIYGSEIDRRFYKRFKQYPMEPDYMKEILGEADEDYFNILLAHNPQYFKEYAGWGADLTLAGHIHGGLVKLPILGGVVSPMVSFFPKYDGGTFFENDKEMILSRGLGTHTIPIRMFNPGELNIITIKGKQEV